uniref:60S ribosomal protein L23a n=1 Tax=Lygus hesperus TaxID=30085 RepID=A0A0A9ZCQ9_LYGHE
MAVETSAKKKQIKKAQTSAKSVNKKLSKKPRHAYTRLTFRRPKTLKLKKNPKYERNPFPSKGMTQHDILRLPLFTSKAMQGIEKFNTITFLCDPRATKKQIRDAFVAQYSARVSAVNTLIRPDAQKKAFIRLAPDSDATEIANKIGLL